MNQNLWMHVLNLRFSRGNWAANVWGTLELPGALISYHKISIFSLLLIESKSVGGCLQLEDLKDELGPQRFGDPKISPGPWFQITKPLNLAFSVWRVKTCWWAFAIWGFESRIGPWTCGELQNFALGPQFDITKCLYLANLAQWATITVQGFEFEALMVVLDPSVWGTSKFHRGPDFK
jgi:hypothetical protein